MLKSVERSFKMWRRSSIFEVESFFEVVEWLANIEIEKGWGGGIYTSHTITTIECQPSDVSDQAQICLMGDSN
jgi:hypothetical protein